MNKIGIIFKREYLSRVRKKTFILTTLLTPLLFAGLIAAVTIITVKGSKHETIAVNDPSGVLQPALTNSDLVTYKFSTTADTSNYIGLGCTALLLAPHTGINRDSNYQVIGENTISAFANDKIHDDVTRAVENHLISQELQVDPKRIDSIKQVAARIHVKRVKTSEIGQDKQNNFDVARAIGYLSAFLIYITLFIYGVMVMRGVMEEKTSRIAEVIVSSVRPFQLMMGKILGIGAVGLTQFLIWILLIMALSFGFSAFLSADTLHQAQQASANMPGSMAQNSEAIQKLNELTGSVNWPLIIVCFLFYFVGGYLFYAALFAAIGSAVNEDPQDAQSLTLPVTMPIIIAIIIMINAINDPSGSLATWASMIPFFSPIIMMARIPFGVPDTVPYWQLALSMLLLIGGFLLTTWFASRIYRTGILMYGKKPSWKEMMRWVRK
jgi:ABC-2 type transport system permease protein